MLVLQRTRSASQKDVQASETCMAVLLGMRSGTAAGRSGEELFGSGASNSSGSVQAMERNVARLFSERGPIFGEIEFTQNSILSGEAVCSTSHPLLRMLASSTHVVF